MAHTERLPSFISAPIAAKLCTYIEARDDLCLRELLDLNELLLVMAEDQRRAYAAEESSR